MIWTLSASTGFRYPQALNDPAITNASDRFLKVPVLSLSLPLHMLFSSPEIPLPPLFEKPINFYSINIYRMNIEIPFI